MHDLVAADRHRPDEPMHPLNPPPVSVAAIAELLAVLFPGGERGTDRTFPGCTRVPDPTTATHLGVSAIARLLEADVAAVLDGRRVLAASDDTGRGVGAGRLPTGPAGNGQQRYGERVGAGGLAGGRDPLPTTVVAGFPGSPSRHLVVTRNARPFSDDERSLAAGMAGVLAAATRYAEVVAAGQAARRRYEVDLRRARRDPLTGLLNRQDFIADLATARPGAALLLLDIDGLRLVNERSGHGAGDEVLRRLADRLRHNLRQGDTLARLGSDLFALLAPDVNDIRAGLEMAQRLVALLGDPFRLEGTTLSCPVSIGVAVAQRHPGTDGDQARSHRLEPAELLAQADLALHEAKQRGPGSVTVFEPGLRAEHLVRMKLEDDLRRAVSTKRAQFRVQYQPVVDLATGTVVGLEALLRWDHPERGLVAPGEFIPVAEAIGVMPELGELVLRRSLAEMGRWRARFASAGAVTLAVNLSARQIEQPDLVEVVEAVLAEHRPPPGTLVLEITETALLPTDPVQTAARLGGLRDLGVVLCLDDFGTGYSSLSHLRRLPVSMLKIDRSFVVDLGGTGSGRPLTTGIISLGRGLGLEIVGEGIETPDQYRELLDGGCQYGQGFLFARPLDPGAVDDLLAAGDSLLPTALDRA